MKKLKTPYYLIDESKLKTNLEIIRYVREQSGAKVLLALKCFSSWCVFDLMRQYMDGTTSSSLYEARLGFEKFGKEVQAYSVAYTQEDIDLLNKFADKIIFNSFSQFNQFYDRVNHRNLGLRVNPGISYSHFDLADPARRFSRLGVNDERELAAVIEQIQGFMFHFNCENDDFDQLAHSLDIIGQKYAHFLEKLEWISLGGGIAFTKKAYPVENFCRLLKQFSERYNLQIYLEPGEAAVTGSTTLVTKVLDVVHNDLDIAVIDASVEAHMLDHLIYQTSPTLVGHVNGDHPVMIAGRTCLAGDIFGTFQLEAPLNVGDHIQIADAGGYTMVKKNWFNGIAMPSIVVKRLNGDVDLIRNFTYQDYLASLS